jgi:predicted acetyltransferase
MDDSPDVSLEPATQRDAVLLGNLLELYVHDLSEIFPIELNPKGRFDYEKLPLYWSEPESRFPFLIRSGGRDVGFALVTRGSPASDDPETLDVAEFFVLRRYRRSAIGARAAAMLWNRMRGPWTVRVSEANRAGVPFWSRTIAAYTNGAMSETTKPGAPHAWRVFSFRSR